MKSTIPPQAHPIEFIASVKRGSSHDVEFSKEPVPTHSDLPDVKIGFAPVSIGGVQVPSTIRVMYVRGERGKEVYWYVVTWRGQADVPDCIDAGSEQEAQSLVFNEIRAWVDS